MTGSLEKFVYSPRKCSISPIFGTRLDHHFRRKDIDMWCWLSATYAFCTALIEFTYSLHSLQFWPNGGGDRNQRCSAVQNAYVVLDQHRMSSSFCLKWRVPEMGEIKHLLLVYKLFGWPSWLEVSKKDATMKLTRTSQSSQWEWQPHPGCIRHRWLPSQWPLEGRCACPAATSLEDAHWKKP